MKRTQIIFLLIVLVSFTFGCTQDVKDSNNSKIIENEQDPFIIIENNEQMLDKSHFKFKFNTLDNNEQYQYDAYLDNGYIHTKYVNNLTSFNNLICNDINEYNLYISWTPFHTEEKKIYSSYATEANLVIIQKYNYNIIGYVIVHFEQLDNVYYKYKCQIIKSMSFPKINNKYQKINDDYFKDMVSFEETEKFASGPIVEEHRENLIKFYTKEGSNTVGHVEILDINDCIQFYFIDDAEGQFNSAIATYGTFQHGMLINISKFNKIMGSLYLWTPLNSEYDESKFCDKAYILAISNTDFVNIAYAIIEVSQDTIKQNVYYAKTIESVFFPKIDGKYQNISDEYILDRFQNFLDSTKGENE